MDKIAIYYGDNLNTGQYDNGVWMDILKIPFIKTVDEAKDYDIIIRTLFINKIGFSQKIRKKFPHIIQIGLSDPPLMQISKLNPHEQAAYLRDLRYLDGIMALTEEERQWYKTASHKPTIKIGLPFPFESYKRDYNKLSDAKREFIGLGVGAFSDDRNFISSFIVFRQLKKKFPYLRGVYMSLPESKISQTSLYAKMGKDIYIHKRKNMNEFYNILSKCKLVINLVDRNSPGRLQGEAAFFGIPVVGSNKLELQNELFPELAVSPYEVENAVMLAEKMLNGHKASERIVKKAYKNLQKYNYQHSRKKFDDFLKKIKSDRTGRI